MAASTSSQSLASGGLAREKKRAGISSGTAKFERSEVLVPVAIGYVGILGLPLGQREKILFGDLPLLGAVAQM
jgi:hypothetical protein